jgi:S-adenosylmethionine synthetase
MARKIAVDFIKSGKAKKVFVKLAYAIGKAEPVMAVVNLDGKEEIPIEGYDLTPKGIRKMLNLENVKFAETAKWGHFGRGFNWDR